MKIKIRTTILSLGIFVFSTPVLSETICSLDYSAMDPLQIKEEDLNENSYNNSIEYLKNFEEIEFEIEHDINFYIVTHGALQTVEGYVLKLIAIKTGSERDATNFCLWLKDRKWSD